MYNLKKIRESDVRDGNDHPEISWLNAEQPSNIPLPAANAAPTFVADARFQAVIFELNTMQLTEHC
jgi:hypothetical protein